MEPSLRSSTPRGVECKLRRTDPAVHESMKRFVESLCPDVRISQYADLNFAAKRFESDTWYWLEPVAGGRVGYLIFLPDQPVIWIDDQFKQSFKIQMRVSSNIYKKHSVMIASLNRVECLLRLEDVWVLSGKSSLDDSFTKRWNQLLQFYGEDFKEDLSLQQGLRILPASYKSLASAIEWMNDPQRPNMMFAQGEKAPRRLRVQFEERVKAENNKAIVPPFFYADEQEKKARVNKKQIESKRPMFIEDSEQNVTNDTNEKVTTARAVAHEEYPDTYNLWIRNVKKGYAAVQDLELSRILREATKNKNEVMVNIEWNDEFNMYQIVSRA